METDSHFTATRNASDARRPATRAARIGRAPMLALILASLGVSTVASAQPAPPAAPARAIAVPAVHPHAPAAPAPSRPFTNVFKQKTPKAAAPAEQVPAEMRVRLSAPKQGPLGDCYFIAGMSAVAQRRPDLVRDAITEIAPDKVQVRLFQASVNPKNGKKTFKPVVVELSAEDLAKGNYVESTDDSKWPAYLEKAYAKMNGGFAAIENGIVSNAIEAMTGQEVTNHLVSDGQNINRNVIDTIADAIRTGRPLAAGSLPDDAFARGLRSLNVAVWGTSQRALSFTGVAPSHSYAVLGLGEKDGKRLVVLRNPWAKHTPARDGSGVGQLSLTNNGTFALPEEEFLALFGYVAVGGEPPAPKAAKASPKQARAER